MTWLTKPFPMVGRNLELGPEGKIGELRRLAGKRGTAVVVHQQSKKEAIQQPKRFIMDICDESLLNLEMQKWLPERGRKES